MHGPGQVMVVYEVLPATWTNHNRDGVVVQEPASTNTINQHEIVA